MMINKVFINIFFSICLFSLILCLGGCDWFKKSIDEDINSIYKNLYLINVNGKDLFEDARIVGSLNIEYDQLEDLAKKLNKDYDIVFYCTDYACTESDRAAKLMRKLGFEKVLVYPGGIHEWYQLSLKNNEKYPFVGSATQKFLQRPIQILSRDEANTISAEDLSDLLMSRMID